MDQNKSWPSAEKTAPLSKENRIFAELFICVFSFNDSDHHFPPSKPTGFVPWHRLSIR